MKEYRFKTPDGKLLQVTLNEEQTAIVTQAESDYIVARDYILSECYYIWRHAYKTYHLSTKDRESRLAKQPDPELEMLVNVANDIFCASNNPKYTVEDAAVDAYNLIAACKQIKEGER